MIALAEGSERSAVGLPDSSLGLSEEERESTSRGRNTRRARAFMTQKEEHANGSIKTLRTVFRAHENTPQPRPGHDHSEDYSEAYQNSTSGVNTNVMA